MDGEEALVLSKKYTRESLVGLGALKGAPCTIKTIEPIVDTDGDVLANVITFEWTATDGTVKTDTITIKNGEDGNGVTYVHTQTTASTRWYIQHNLDTSWDELTVIVTETGNGEIIGKVDTVNSTVNLLVIEFEKATAGKAVVKK